MSKFGPGEDQESPAMLSLWHLLNTQAQVLRRQLGIRSEEFEREFSVKNIYLRVMGVYSTLKVLTLLRSLRK